MYTVCVCAHILCVCVWVIFLRYLPVLVTDPEPLRVGYASWPDISLDPGAHLFMKPSPCFVPDDLLLCTNAQAFPCPAPEACVQELRNYFNLEALKSTVAV